MSVPQHMDIWCLWPWMPSVVKDEIKELGDPNICKWGPMLKQWLDTSQQLPVEMFRNSHRALARHRYRQALREAQEVADYAKDRVPEQKGAIRYSGLIHPDLKAFNEDQFQKDTLPRTKKDHHKLFVQ